MVVLVGVGHAEVDRYAVEEVGLGQGHAAACEIAFHIEHQAVGADLEAGVVVEHAVGVAAVGVEFEALDQRREVAVRGVELHRHAGGGAAVHGVQNVRTQAHGASFQKQSTESVYTFCLFWL